MIVNSGGENIAPVPIENLLLSYEEVEQAIIYGYNRPFLIALIVPNENLLNTNSYNPNNLTDNFQKIVNHVNEGLSQTKKIRKFIVLDKNFTIENSLLTPTLKIKRYKIYTLYKDKIERLYKKTFF
jgi:long-chain acyl-CoA synthetase